MLTESMVNRALKAHGTDDWPGTKKTHKTIDCLKS